LVVRGVSRDMATTERGVTALDRLRSRYERDDMECSACGYVDEDGRWRSTTDGSQVHYSHVCPRCGQVRRRTYRL
jgi:predicted RNA-binding Zn-ribbon protein involved in translation (DUF1610 family)